VKNGESAKLAQKLLYISTKAMLMQKCAVVTFLLGGVSTIAKSLLFRA